MKNFMYICLAVLATVLLFSCTEVEPSVPQEVTVDYKVTLETTTKASDASEINYIWYAIYRTDGSFICSFRPAEYKNGMADCPVTVVMDTPYKVVFVGMHFDDDTPIYNIEWEKAQILMPETAVANSEKYDCFFGSDGKNPASVQKAAQPVVLKRLTSRVSFLCTQEAWDAAAQKPQLSSLSLSGAAKGFNMLEGKFLDETVDVDYGKAQLPAEMQDGKKILCTAYCLSDGDVDAELKLWDEGTLAPFKTVTANDIPAERNIMTNIVCGIE